MSNLQQLRDEIFKLKALLEHKEKLLLERETIAETIETKSLSSEEAKKLKLTLRELDTEIDRLDEFNETLLFKRKEEYLALFLKTYPDKRIDYEKKLQDEARLKSERHHLERLKAFLSPIQFHLNRIETARARIKKRGNLKLSFWQKSK